MPRLQIRVGSVLFFRMWFWVVDRRINSSWRLRGLKTSRFLCLPQWELWESCQNGQCKLVAPDGGSRMEAMEMSSLRALASQMMRLAEPPED